MIKIFPNLEELNNFAAEKFVEIAHDSMEMHGFFHVALAGGSTPKAFYQLLASDKFRDKIFWKAVQFYFGDERNVPPTDAESNFRMAKENLFDPLKISELNVARWQTEYKNLERIADVYNKRLIFSFSKAGGSIKPDDNGFPRFDLVILGMGADGHTASLFPYTEALQETEKFAVVNYVEKLGTTRLTLTFPVINNARNIIFLVAGEEKAETLKKVLEGEFEPQKYPAQNVRPRNGELFWLVDEKAAQLLKK